MTIQELLTVPALKAWLKTQDPEKTYIYDKSDTCLTAAFLHASGYPAADVWHSNVMSNGAWYDIPADFHKVTVYGAENPEQELKCDDYDDDQINEWQKTRTYGGALQAALEISPD